MTETDVVDVFEIFPCPVEGGEFAIGAVFLGNVVAGVVALESEVEFRVECFADLYRHVDIVLTYIRVCLVASHKYLYSRLFLLFHCFTI